MQSTRATGDRTGPPIPYRVAVWLWTRLAGPSRLRPTSGGGLALVVVSAAVSLAAVGALGETMRIRWTVGIHYGPEYASTTVVLAAIPSLVAVAAVACRGLATVLERADEFDGARPYYELAVLVVLLWLIVAQVALVVANLW